VKNDLKTHHRHIAMAENRQKYFCRIMNPAFVRGIFHAVTFQLDEFDHYLFGRYTELQRDHKPLCLFYHPESGNFCFNTQNNKVEHTVACNSTTDQGNVICV
jgi:hypothetical protein